MMDIETVQKINALALNLMKQGLAQSRDEAVAQAEKMFKDCSPEGDNYSSIRERMTTTDTKEKSTVSSEDIPQEKIKEILEQNTKFLVKKITEFQEKVASLEKELQSLKNKIAYRSIPSAGEILTKEATKESESNPKSVKSESVPAKHPRSGDYTDSDVSIEKFFYMGNKK